MNKFRASYSVLNTWHGGNYEMAVKMYFHLEQFTTPAMADGIRYHKLWASYIDKNKQMPVEFGGESLLEPRTELKKVITLAPWLDLVGVIDCFDTSTIYEFKTGKTSSQDYANSKQPIVYQVLMHELKPNKAIVHRYDQHKKKSDMSIVHLTETSFRHGVKWIVENAKEMHAYLTDQGLYERFART